MTLRKDGGLKLQVTQQRSLRFKEASQNRRIPSIAATPTRSFGPPSALTREDVAPAIMFLELQLHLSAPYHRLSIQFTNGTIRPHSWGQQPMLARIPGERSPIAT